MRYTDGTMAQRGELIYLALGTRSKHVELALYCGEHPAGPGRYGTYCKVIYIEPGIRSSVLDRRAVGRAHPQHLTPEQLTYYEQALEKMNTL